MSLILLLGAVSTASAANRLYINGVNIEPGETRALALVLDNDQSFYGFQFDLELPEGLELVYDNNKPEILFASRTNGSYSPASNVLANGKIRIGSFSTYHVPIIGETGVLMYISVHADNDFDGGVVSLTDILFTDASNRDVELPDYSMQLGNVHENKLYIEDFKIAIGQTLTIPVILENETDFTAFQTDIYLPEGLSIVDGSCRLSDRFTSMHKLSVKSFSDGRVRIVCLAENSTSFAVNPGPILTFDIRADKRAADVCKIELRNNIFATSNAHELVLDNSETEVTTERAMVTGIIVNPGSAAILIGDTQTLTAEVYPEYASDRDVIWESEDETIATVSPDGVVTAVGVGETRISATAADGSGVVGYCDVQIAGRPVGNIILDRTTLNLKVGESGTIVATVTPDNATDKTLTWTSENPDIASVDAEGNVTAYTLGQTTITVESVSTPGQTAQCVVNVVPTFVESITVEPANILMYVGETYSLAVHIEPLEAEDKSVTWSSLNDNLITVDENGIVTAVSHGTTRIKATANDGSEVSGYCSITILPTPPDSISINTPDRTEFRVGESYYFSATVFPETTVNKNVGWESTNQEIAEITAWGTMTTKAIGTTTLIATDCAGHTDSIEISVVPTLIESLSILPETATIFVGDEITFIPTILPEDATDKTVSWSVSDPEIISISDDTVTGLKYGTAEVTVWANDNSNLTATATVTVNPVHPEEIEITREHDNPLKVGSTVQLYAKLLPEFDYTNPIKWESDNTNVATVDETGLVTCVGVGDAFVYASVGNVSHSVLISVGITLVEEIVLNTQTAALKVGDYILLSANVLPATATHRELTWSSSNPEIASIDDNRWVHLNAPGEATITFSAKDGSGVTATCHITTVEVPAEGIVISPSGGFDLHIGDTVQLSATVYPENASDKTVTWDVQNANVVQVSDNGLVTAVGLGYRVWVRATDSAGHEDIVYFDVYPIYVSDIQADNRFPIILNIGDTYTPRYQIYPNNATISSLSWSSTNTDVAVVDDFGNIYAKGVGEADVIAKANDGSGVNVSWHIIVNPVLPQSITIEPHGPFTLKIGDTLQLSATVLPENATDKSVVWRSDAPGAGTVDENGLVTILAEGEFGIFAENAYGQTDHVVIKVPRVYIEEIKVTPAGPLYLNPGDTEQIEVTVLPDYATNKNYSWVSTNPEVAYVDEDGRLFAVIPGLAFVYAEAEWGLVSSSAIEVHVNNYPFAQVETIDVVADGPTTLRDGETVQLRAILTPDNGADVTWYSDNETIATVDYNGLVTAHAKLGEARITAYAGGVTSNGFVITVEETPLESITLDIEVATLELGQTYVVTAQFQPQNATFKEVGWSITKESVARIIDYTATSCTVEAVGTGTAYLCAMTRDGYTRYARINVPSVPVESITLDKKQLQLKVGETGQLTAKIEPANATDKTLRWVSENNSVVEIVETSEAGCQIKGVSAGSTYLDVYTNDGSDLAAWCLVTVVKPVEKITLNEHNLTLTPEDEFSLVAEIEPIDATDKSVEWSSENPEVATVDENGVVHAIGEGETEIAVRTLDGSALQDTCHIKIVKDNTGMETISINGLSVSIEGIHVTVSGIKAGELVKLHTLDGLEVYTEISTGDKVAFDILPDTRYILTVGSRSVKL